MREIEFKEGRYEIGLPCKQIDDKPLPNDFQLSFDRLNSLYSRLEKDLEILAEYTRIIDEQIKLGIVEYVPKEEQTCEFIEQNNVHFLPHFAVIRTDRETTRLRIVFDGSAKTANWILRNKKIWILRNKKNLDFAKSTFLTTFIKSGFCERYYGSGLFPACFPLGAKIVVWFGGMNIEDTTCSRSEVLKLYLVSFILSFIIMESRSLTGDPSAHH